MKLSEYAKKLGLSYDTVLEHFHKDQIPGAYKLPTGTIIVPGILGDENQRVQLDLDGSIGTQFDLGTNDDGSAAKKKPKTQTDMLRSQLEAVRTSIENGNSSGFAPEDFMNVGSVLPKGPVTKARNYQMEWDAMLGKCMLKIDAIVSNFIDDERQRQLPRFMVMIEEHAEKLCELEFATMAARETLFTLKEAIDTGEPVERAFELQDKYLTQMKSTSNNRSQHLSNVENYWERQADRLGIQDESTKVAEEQAAEQAVEIEADEKMHVKDTRTLNDDVEEMMKKLKEEGFGG